jgi:hypothetical protein
MELTKYRNKIYIIILTIIYKINLELKIIN